MAIARTIAVAQGKGGVGKTSIVSNVGGLAAAAGVRTLIVDLDLQGNMSRDLGYPPSDGKDLFNAFVIDGPLPLLRDVRPGLDVVYGGAAFGDIGSLDYNWHANRQPGFGERLERSLAALAGEYELILLDTPPGDRIISEGALVAASSVIIPTRSDEASLDGVELVAKRFQAIGALNPQLKLAGVVLFALESRSVRLEREVRASLDALLGGAAPVFQTRIRALSSAAVDQRSRGLLVHELEKAAKDDRAKRLAALKKKQKPVSGLFASDVSGLADDYAKLTREILSELARLEAEEAAIS